MRFLIVDDDLSKINLVRSFLIKRGIPEQDILIAEHASSARIALESGWFDVLLIDVLLPARRGDFPRGENSLELLKQIVEDGTTKAPSHILGITASVDALSEFKDEFQSLVAHVLLVAPGETAWCTYIESLLLFYRRIANTHESHDFDICVLNALRTPELEAVLATWPIKLGDEKVLSGNILYRAGTILLNGVSRRVVCAHLSQMGPVASTHAAVTLLGKFRPKTLVMTGICGGFSELVNVGDVVVADKSWDWQAGKWSDGNGLSTALDQRDGDVSLVAEARAIESTLDRLYTAYVDNKPDRKPKLVIGPMVSGSAVVASLDIQKVFRTQHRKMVAIDMECYGVYYAAANHLGAPVRVICIKSVSDLADKDKSDDYQKYCSYMSASVTLEVLQRFFKPAN